MTKRLKGPVELLDQRRHEGVYTRAMLGFDSRDNGIRDIAAKIKQCKEARDHRTRHEIVQEISRIEIEVARLEVRKERLAKKVGHIKNWKITEIVLESIEYDLHRIKERAAEIEKRVEGKFRIEARLDDLDALVISGDVNEIIRRANNFGGSCIIRAAMAKISYHRELIDDQKRTEMAQQLGLANDKLVRSNDKRHRSLTTRINDRKDYQEALGQIAKLEAHASITRREVNINNSMIEEEILDLNSNLDQISSAMIAGTAMYLIRTKGLGNDELKKTIAAASLIVKLDNEITQINSRLNAIKARESHLLSIAKQG